MPNPKTIEELLKMKPCPFEHGKLIPEGAFKIAEKNGLMDKDIYLIAWSLFRGEPFKMPEGYFYLPPDKQLGLPLGEWDTIQLKPLIDVLPYGVIEKYTNGDTSIINCPYGQDYRVTNYNLVSTHNRVAILKQPPNLYNPLDHKEEVPTVEAPVEPKRVSVQEFAKNPAGKWVSWAKLGYQEFIGEKTDELTNKVVLDIIATGNPIIYATDPTAWLASQAEQEGKSV